MAIIINDRRAREQEEARQEAEPEEEVDHTWHPTEEELPDPISTERWLAMLDDPSVFDEDGLRAVECVDDYGGPVTFQQLSVRYRGTMGRYRRWLNGVAERAAIHEGREPLGTDEAGALRWWPYLYRQRAAGKATANVHEMLLRPELTEALRRRRESSKARQRQEEQAQAVAAARRRSEERKARLEAAARAEEKRAQEVARPPVTPGSEAAAPKPEVASRASRPRTKDALPAQASQSQGGARTAAAPTAGDGTEGFPALAHFLETMASLERKSAPAHRSALGEQAPRPGKRQRLDYARRYGERLYDALELVREGVPGLTAAQVARELGDDSVERLQRLLNGEEVPSFAYLDKLCGALFLNRCRLETPDGLVEGEPTFSTLRERRGADLGAPLDEPPREVVFVTDDSPSRRCGAILRWSELRCALVERQPVSADADRYHDAALAAYIDMVREMDARAGRGELATRSIKVSSGEWDALAEGRLWPGTLCLAG